MKKQNIGEEFPPFLRKLKEKEDGFKVPEGYFEDFEDAVFARLKAAGDLDRPAMKVAKRPTRFTFSIRPGAIMALAAALALVLAAVLFFRQNTAGIEGAQLASTELSEDDIESYLLENAIEFEPQQLAELSKEEVEKPSIYDGTPNSSQQSTHPAEEIHPDDLDQILDEMTEEELEQIL